MWVWILGNTNYCLTKNGTVPIKLKKEHAGMMMILLKIVRESMQHGGGNLEDICGYTEGVRRCHNGS